MAPPKYPHCVDCKYHSPRDKERDGFAWEDETDFCEHCVNPVTGKTERWPCFLNRRRFWEETMTTYETCGIEAKYFEPKDS
jgi:hypothetical protein